MKKITIQKKYASDKTIKDKLEIWLLKNNEIGKLVLSHKRHLIFNFFLNTAFKIRIFNMTLKLATCCLYIAHIISLHSSETDNSILNMLEILNFQ